MNKSNIRSLSDLCIDKVCNLIADGSLQNQHVQLFEDQKNCIYQKVIDQCRVDGAVLDIFCSQLGITMIDLTGAYVAVHELNNLRNYNITALRLGSEGNHGFKRFVHPEEILIRCFRDRSMITFLDLSYLWLADTTRGTLESVQSCPNLEHLILDGVDLTNEQFDFSRITKLQHLNLSSSYIRTISGIEKLTDLKSLILYDISVSERDATELLKLNSLTVLDISVRNMVNKNLFHIVRFVSEKSTFFGMPTPWPNLMYLDLSGNSVHINRNVGMRMVATLVKTHPRLSWIGLFNTCLSNVEVTFPDRKIRIMNLYSPENLLNAMEIYSKGGKFTLVNETLVEIRKKLEHALRTFNNAEILRAVRLLTTTIKVYGKTPGCVMTQFNSLNCLLLITEHSDFIELLPQRDIDVLTGQFLIIMEFFVHHDDLHNYDVNMRESPIATIWKRLDHRITDSKIALKICTVISKRLFWETTNTFRQDLLRAFTRYFSKINDDQKDRLVGSEFFSSLVFSMRQSSSFFVGNGDFFNHGLEFDVINATMDTPAKCRFFIENGGLDTLLLFLVRSNSNVMAKVYQVINILIHHNSLDTKLFVKRPLLLNSLIRIHARIEDIVRPGLNSLKSNIEYLILHIMRSPFYSHYRKNGVMSFSPEEEEPEFDDIEKSDEDLMEFFQETIRKTKEAALLVELLWAMRSISKKNLTLKNMLSHSRAMRIIRKLARGYHRYTNPVPGFIVDISKKIVEGR